MRKNSSRGSIRTTHPGEDSRFASIRTTILGENSSSGSMRAKTTGNSSCGYPNPWNVRSSGCMRTKIFGKDSSFGSMLPGDNTSFCSAGTKSWENNQKTVVLVP